MAKKKAKVAKKKAAKPAKKVAAKAASKILKKPATDGKGYTKSALYASLAEKACVTKKQAQTVVEDLVGTMISFAPAGASLPGLGKLVLKKTPKRPAREGRNPATGETIMLPPKPAGKKLVFRVSKAGKVAAGIAK